MIQSEKENFASMVDFRSQRVLESQPEFVWLKKNNPKIVNDELATTFFCSKEFFIIHVNYLSE